MKEGDFIKLGRVRFRIREVKTCLDDSKQYVGFELEKLEWTKKADFW
jgi:hypothetical protein